RRGEAWRHCRCDRLRQSRWKLCGEPTPQIRRGASLHRNRRQALCRAAARGLGRHPALERPASPVIAEQPRHRTLLAFAAVTSLFFAWGFITSNNDPLIVALRAAFTLDYTEALLTQIVFFLAYGF